MQSGALTLSPQLATRHSGPGRHQTTPPQFSRLNSHQTPSPEGVFTSGKRISNSGHSTADLLIRRIFLSQNEPQFSRLNFSALPQGPTAARGEFGQRNSIFKATTHPKHPPEFSRLNLLASCLRTGEGHREFSRLNSLTPLYPPGHTRHLFSRLNTDRNPGQKPGFRTSGEVGLEIAMR